MTESEKKYKVSQVFEVVRGRANNSYSKKKADFLELARSFFPEVSDDALEVISEKAYALGYTQCYSDHFDATELHPIIA